MARRTATPLGKQRIAITGGGGFIGAHLMVRLVSTGARLVLLGPPPLWRKDVQRIVERGAADWVPDALTGQPTVLSEALSGCDALVHLGYRAPEPGAAVAMYRSELRLNVLPTADLLDAASAAGIQYIAFASSVDVYPPASENREDGPVQPTTPYATAKLTQEGLLRAWSADAGCSSAIVRLTTVYGPGEPVRRAIPRFISAVLQGQPPHVHGQGSQPFAPVYVGDVADALMAAMRQRAHGTYNLAGSVHTVREVAELVIRLCGAGVGVREDHSVPQRPVPMCSASLAAQVLGFRPTALTVGLAEEIRWFRDQLGEGAGMDMTSSSDSTGPCTLTPSGAGPFDAGSASVQLA